MQKYRKISQTLFFFLIILIPIMNMLEIYYIKGSYISLDVGKLAVSDPLAVFQAIFLSHEVNAVMMASIALPLIITLLFGRVWCSFACPYLLIAEGIASIRKFFRLKPLKSKVTTFKANLIRCIVLLVGFIFVGILGVPILYLISPPSIISTQFILIIKQFVVSFEILFLLLMLITEFFFISHFWCKFICPTGSILALFKSKRGLHIGYLGNCSNCERCTKICPFGVDPKADTYDFQCNNCGKCVGVCKDNLEKKTLFFTFKCK